MLRGREWIFRPSLSLPCFSYYRCLFPIPILHTLSLLNMIYGSFIVRRRPFEKDTISPNLLYAFLDIRNGVEYQRNDITTFLCKYRALNRETSFWRRGRREWKGRGGILKHLSPLTPKRCLCFSLLISFREDHDHRTVCTAVLCLDSHIEGDFSNVKAIATPKLWCHSHAPPWIHESFGALLGLELFKKGRTV